MSDSERAEILRNTNIKLVEYNGDNKDLNSENILKLKSSYNSQAGKILKALGEKLSVFKDNDYIIPIELHIKEFTEDYK